MRIGLAQLNHSASVTGPLLAGRSPADDRAVRLEPVLQVLEVVRRLDLEAHVVQAGARVIAQDDGVMVLLIPALEVHLARFAGDLDEPGWDFLTAAFTIKMAACRSSGSAGVELDRRVATDA